MRASRKVDEVSWLLLHAQGGKDSVDMLLGYDVEYTVTRPNLSQVLVDARF